MSAIAGIYSLDGRPVELFDLERVVECLAHRGPDGTGVWCDGPIGLGHRALHTTEEARRERLPLATPQAMHVLTADARIDNRDELLSTLGLRDRPAGEIGDGALILAAYERWGEACVDRLVGDFAFALWDRRRQSLFCVRDPMGVRSFYYYSAPGKQFLFATEIKALFALPETPGGGPSVRELDELRVAYHLVRACDDPAITFFRGIERLPAGHALRVDRNGVSLRRYWNPDPRRELRLRSDDEYAEAFRAQFGEAVRCRLRSITPVASTLSGGLDSSSIACMARRLLSESGRGPLLTLSAIFPRLPVGDLRRIDERPYMDAVVRGGAIDATFIRADEISPLVDLDRLLGQMDEPFFAPNLYLHWAMYRAAGARGARVFLDGIDGDTAVSHGLGRLTELAWRGRWPTLFTELSAVATTHHTSRRALLREYCLEPLAIGPARALWRRATGRPAPSPLDDPFLNPEFAVRMRAIERERRAVATKPPGPITARTEHWLSLVSPLNAYALELAEKAAGVVGIEPRYPFFDRRLIEFCLSLPADQKLTHGQTRAILGRAMEGILPPEVRRRTEKANLSRNFQRKLLEFERSTLEATIIDDPSRIAPFVNVDALRARYARFAADPVRDADAPLQLYAALLLDRWLTHLTLGSRHETSRVPTAVSDSHPRRSNYEEDLEPSAAVQIRHREEAYAAGQTARSHGRADLSGSADQGQLGIVVRHPMGDVPIGSDDTLQYLRRRSVSLATRLGSVQ